MPGGMSFNSRNFIRSIITIAVQIITLPIAGTRSRLGTSVHVLFTRIPSSLWLMSHCRRGLQNLVYLIIALVTKAAAPRRYAYPEEFRTSYLDFPKSM